MKGWSARRHGDETVGRGPRSLLLAMAALALLALPGCDQKKPPQAEQTPLRVHGAFGVLELGPLQRAAETSKPPALVRPGTIVNLWRDEGAPPPGTKGEAYGAISAPYLPGHADLAGNAETQALRNSIEHPDARILMTVVEGVYRIVARRSSGIAKLEDLKGKRVATFPATSAAFFLSRQLASVGLSDADVTIVSVRPKEGTDALVAGTVDAFAMYEPEPERAFAALGEDAIEIPNGGIYSEHYNLNTTTATLADPVKRAQVVAYVRELLSACREATEKPERVIALAAESTKYDVELIGKVWNKHHRFVCTMPSDMLDVLAAEEQWLAKLENREARSREQLAPLLDTSILEEARKPK